MTTPEMKADQTKSLVKHSPQNLPIQGRKQPVMKIQNNKSEVNSVEKNDVHETCSTGPPKDSNQEIPEYDVVMLCDSNRKFLDIHKLSATRNSRVVQLVKLLRLLTP